jgi:subtilase family serine protease
MIESSNMYADSDWTTFRSAFGLSGYSGTLTTIQPQPSSGPANCTNLGASSRDFETTLDAEWATAAAPDAALYIANCKDPATGWGGTIALLNLVSQPIPPAIMTVTIEDCEVYFGTANANYNTAYQTGVAGGASIYVAAGDWTEGQCDGGNVATHGIGVSGYASTPYNVAVGGTDFSDTYSGTNSTYWNSTNKPTYGSAKSYIPEIPWNSTCGSVLSATFNMHSTTYGASGFCNSSVGENPDYYASTWGGSGGPSGCATGAPWIPGVVSGTCAGYPKPVWQTGVIGIPNDGVRDLPDVSLFSSFSPWKHGYIICFSDTSNGGVPCTTSPSGWSYDWGGTSFATPIWGAIQALINQKTGVGRWGLPTYRLYDIAAKEYGSSGSSACNSSNGNSVGSSCIFYDVTLGDNDAPCQADSGTLYNCYLPSGTTGVLSTSNSVYAPAYKATTGWDFATGIGTVNVANLVMNWWGVETITPHDFNADGKSDIAWRDDSGDLALWLMNGATVLSSGVVGGVPSTWSIVGQRDFDGDGKADLLWRDTSGNIAMWFMSGTAVGSAASVGNLATTWQVAGVADFNGDGLGDILWRDVPAISPCGS